MLICRITKSVSNDPPTKRSYILNMISNIQNFFRQIPEHYIHITHRYIFISGVTNSIKILQCLQAKKKFSHAEVVHTEVQSAFVGDC